MNMKYILSGLLVLATTHAASAHAGAHAGLSGTEGLQHLSQSGGHILTMLIVIGAIAAGVWYCSKRFTASRE